MTKILAVLGDDVDVAAAQRSLDLSVTRYKGGVTSDLESDHGASDALSDEVTAVNILGRHRADTVLLVQALGGGWGPVDSAAETRMLRRAREQHNGNGSGSRLCC